MASRMSLPTLDVEISSSLPMSLYVEPFANILIALKAKLSFKTDTDLNRDNLIINVFVRGAKNYRMNISERTIYSEAEERTQGQDQKG